MFPINLERALTMDALALFNLDFPDIIDPNRSVHLEVPFGMVVLPHQPHALLGRSGRAGQCSGW